MFQKKVTKDEVNELPLLQYEGEITQIATDGEYKDAMSRLNREPVIGFDTEKKPVFTKGQYNHVALLQIAIPDEVLIFKLNLLGMRTGLVRFFEDPDIRKVGISIRDDIQDLRKMNPPLHEKNVFEINDAAAKLEIENQGVRNLSAIILGGRISKSQQVSNWESPELTDKQLTYAATDAWVCLEIYSLLDRKGFIYE
jgi:ribonuclease D